MITGRRCVLPLIVALLLLSTAACNDGAKGTASSLREPAVDSSDTRAHRLITLVERADTLSTLARALRQAGLAQDLRRGGPYTLFAPTDRAFRQNLPGFDSLLAPAGTSATAGPSATGGRQPLSDRASQSPPARYDDSLRTVLQFHLVRGRFTAADIGDSLRLGTLIGESFLLERAPRSENRLRLQVKGTPGPVPIARTLEAQNGVLHVLPRPLRIPPPDTSSQGALRLSDTTSVDTTSAAPASN